MCKSAGRMRPRFEVIPGSQAALVSISSTLLYQVVVPLNRCTHDNVVCSPAIDLRTRQTRSILRCPTICACHPHKSKLLIHSDIGVGATNSDHVSSETLMYSAQLSVQLRFTCIVPQGNACSPLQCNNTTDSPGIPTSTGNLAVKCTPIPNNMPTNSLIETPA